MISRELRERAIPYLTGEKRPFATTLLSILVRAYGLDVLEWDGLTIQLQVKDDFGVELPRRSYDAVMALILCLTTDKVYTQVEIFDEVVSALGLRGVGVEQDAPAVTDVAWAVRELQLNDPEPASRNPEQPWGPNIRRYVTAVLAGEGMYSAPQDLAFANSPSMRADAVDDPERYRLAFGASQERAAEIDTWVDTQAEQLILQLMDIGLDLRASEETPRE